MQAQKCIHVKLDMNANFQYSKPNRYLYEKRLKYKELIILLRLDWEEKKRFMYVSTINRDIERLEENSQINHSKKLGSKCTFPKFQALAS